jgi:hypothetical protein
MKCYRVFDITPYLVEGIACRYASGQVRNVGTIVAIGNFLDYHGISHKLLPTPFYLSLFVDADQRPWGEIIARFARHRDSAGLDRMNILAMAPFLRMKLPRIAFRES